jgi:DNA-binding transcriptional MerR regulator
MALYKTAAEEAAFDYTIGEVATLVGLSPNTIRAWERRYAVVRPRRTTSRQRRYSEEDVELLRRVRRELMAGGLSIQGAARTERSRPDRGVSGLTAPSATDGIGPWRAVADLLPDLILILENGRIVDANVAVARLSGRLRERLSGAPFADLVEPYDRAKAVAAASTLSGSRRGWELNMRSPERSQLISFDLSPVHAGPKVLLAIIGRPL